MPKPSEPPKDEPPSDALSSETSEVAQPSARARPAPDQATLGKLHETLPEGLPRASNAPGGHVPGTAPEDPTQATDPSAAKPGTPGVD